MLPRSSWLLALCLALPALAQDPCTATSNSLTYDLRSLARNSGSDYTIVDPESQETFYLNVCRTTLKEAYGVDDSKLSTIGVYRERDGKGQSLGSFNTTLRVNSANSVSLIYKRGSTCPTLSGVDMSSILTLTCSNGDATESPIFVGSPDGCSFMFLWKTPAACPIAHYSGVWHAVWMFLAVVLLAAVVYFISGVAYKRLVLHKQGMDMFPNVVPAPLVDGLLFVKDMALVSVLTVWESVSSLVARVTGRRGGGFRGLPQDDERGLFDAMEDD